MASSTCRLCNGQVNESVHHFFFLFPYSAAVWTQVQSLLCISQQAFQFDMVVNMVAKASRKKSNMAVLFFIAFASSLYCIWFQRNAAIFKGHVLSTDQLFREVVFRIACRCKEQQKSLLLL